MSVEPEATRAHLRLVGLVVLSLIAALATSWDGARCLAQDEIDEIPLIPIGQAITDRDGDTVPDLIGRTVHVRGVVTVPTGVISDAYLQAFIQDATGALFLFDRKVERDLAIGDLVDAIGQIDQYRGAIQLVNPRYEILGRADAPEPSVLTIREAASWTSFGRLVRLEGVLGQSESQTIILIPLRDSDDPGAKIDVFIPRKIERGMRDTDYAPGVTVAVVGAVSIRAYDRPYLDGFQVVLRDPSDIKVLRRPTPPWVRDVLVGALVSLLFATLALLTYLGYRNRVAKRERELALVNDLSALIASPHLDQDQLLDSAVKMIRERASAKGVAIQLIVGHGELDLAQWDGMSDEDLEILRQEILPSTKELHARTNAIDALERRGFRLFARLPISGRRRAIGILTVFSSHRVAGPDTIAILSTAAGIIGVGLENAEMARESQEREAELKLLAITDDLTGLYNRRFLEEYLRIQLAMAHRQREPMSFITIDLDHFKNINDARGHETGDKILTRVGEIIRVAARASDLPVRLGGDEFLIVMPQTDASGARVFAERLIESIALADFSHIDRSGALRITASGGVASFPEHGDRVRALMRKADEALYRAKGDGRNMIRVSG